MAPRRPSVGHRWPSSDEPSPASRVLTLATELLRTPWTSCEAHMGLGNSAFRALPWTSSVGCLWPKPNGDRRGVSIGKNRPLKEGQAAPATRESNSYRPLTARRNHDTSRSRSRSLCATPHCRQPAARPSCERHPARRNRVLRCVLPIVAPTEAGTSPDSRTPQGCSRRPPGFRCRFQMAPVNSKRPSTGLPKVTSTTEVTLPSCGMRSRGHC